MATIAEISQTAVDKQDLTFAPINSLPDELLLVILDLLPEVSGSFKLGHAAFGATLYLPLTLVSRTFNRIATPLLYSEIAPTYDSLNKFASNPELLQHVRRVEVVFCTRYQEFYVRTPDKLELPALAQRFDLPWSGKLLADASGYDLQALRLATVLCQTPHVQELYVDSPNDGTRAGYVSFVLDPLILSTSGTSQGIIHTFEHLQTLEINMEEVWIGRASCLFKLKLLKHLTMFNLSSKHRPKDDDGWTCLPKSSSVQNLRLSCYVIRAPGLPASVLAAAVASCRKLRSFSVKLYHALTRTGWVEVVNALLQQQDSLHSLELNDVWHTDLKYDLIGEPFQEFQQLIALRHLIVPLCFVSSLDTLTLDWASHSIGYTSQRSQRETSQVFSNFLEAVDTSFPCIRDIWVDYRLYTFSSENKMPMDFSYLQRKCSEHGIEFGFALGFGCINFERDIEEAKQCIISIQEGDYRFNAEEVDGPPLFSLTELGYLNEDSLVNEMKKEFGVGEDFEMIRPFSMDRALELDGDSGKVFLPCLGCLHRKTSNSAVRTRNTLPNKRMRAQRKCPRCDM
ncbi:hypothetical protein BDV96DRAFT_591514 [Lophiotrema nucula]|uniref:Uncharacterized protein n=1 Tax=Lophiotrema nucula TaxID=690887 RepID=A0A6A5YFT0_9PLEO|nr:hypothetical protein BDV96DRAFT_591514 [Lophiotrema nucula]